MKAAEISFRDVYHRVCFVKAGKNYEAMTQHLPNHEQGNGTLVYGYIDHQCGLTYEILACAKQNESGSIEVFQGNDTVSLKFRAGSIAEDELFVITEDEQLRKTYQNKIDAIERHYRNCGEIEAARKVEAIDTSRSPEFPDDVLVILIHGNNAPEGCWVRCEKIADGMMAGTLLNEPDSDFGVHRGDLISFGIAQQGDRLLCVAVL